MFKAIWIPLGVSVAIVLMGILTVIVRDCGWEVPFRWMVIIGVLAYFADKAVNP